MSGRRSLALLLPFVVFSFAANSLITRFVVARGLLDAGLVGATRFAAGTLVLAAVALARGERTLVRRAHLVPALWLGIYAVVIPILTAAGAVALLGEPLTAALFLAAALVAAGMWLARPARA